jgi:hypothetical protein
MNDDRVRYYFILLNDHKIVKHGLMLQDEAWQWTKIDNKMHKTMIRFFNQDGYEQFLKEQQKE